MVLSVLIIGLSAAVCWFCCGKVRDTLLAASIMDHPNERSMHAAPVPRGGGIALWITVCPIWILYDVITGQCSPHFFLMLGAAGVIAVSWMDDKKSLPAHTRFMVHILAVATGLASFPFDDMVFQGIFPLWLDRFMAGLAWLWFMNLTNFMDGIDGLSGVQTTHTAIGFILFATLSSGFPHNDIILAACLAGSALGFLIWNWHPARLFLGDVGSIPVVYLLGYLMVNLAIHGYLGIAITLPLYYVADASITLLRRILEKKKFWHAHREHFYQQATLGAGSPVPVVKAIMIANGALLLLSIAAITLSVWVLVFAPLLVAGLLWYLMRMSNLRPMKEAERATF